MSGSQLKKLITSHCDRAPLLTAVLLMLLGIVICGSFNWGMELTNTESFCISCHEMRENVYVEYKESAHFNNSSGVRATCPDCHVPKVWISKVIRKIKASSELVHKVLGSIDSREKFLNKRLILAQRVWTTMEANDSLECRNCHQLTFINTSMQNDSAKQAHQKAQQQHLTCINCHKGIAHQLPEEFLDSEHERFERENVACSNCHSGLNFGTEQW
jgi:cytochrome c-type protein NapC